MRRWAIGLMVPMVALSVLTVGCGPDGETTPGETTPGTGVAARVIVDGLVGPTQFVVEPSGDLLVAQLNGGENAATGQVVRVDPRDPAAERQVVLDDLDKPTGVALFNDELWVMERNRLTRGPVDPDTADTDDRIIVADELPFNGRSEGSLTVDGERLLYDTSGAIQAGRVVADSGTLWAIAAAGSPTVEATGLKHAYAQARTADGRLFSTEIADGRYDGEVPPDEVVEIDPGNDQGWPRCVGDNRPVAEYGGTAANCDEIPTSHAIFPTGATPTSIVVAPWDDDLLLVALWNEGRVVGVRASQPGAPITDVFTGAEHPQHLVVDGDRVLLSDHIAGTITELTWAG